MQQANTPAGRLRTLAVWIALAAILAVPVLLLARMTTNPDLLSVDDFVVYWSAGRLNVLGANPYDPDQLLALQHEAGRFKDVPLVMWYPPAALTLVMPFGLLSYPIARALWMILHFSLVIFCADWLWRFYGGSEQRRWAAWLVSFAFFATLFVLKVGQIGPLMLLGIVGFLHFEKKEKDGLAGTCAALLTIKPQLLFLVWLALLVWIIERRRWPILFGVGLACLISTAIPLITNPAAISQYCYIIANPPPVSSPPLEWLTPTIGIVLRVLFGPEKIWLQFIPSVLGALWFGYYWRKHRREWTWGAQMPLVLLATCICAPYGWVVDQVVLLVAMVQASVWLLQSAQHHTIRWAIASYLGINCLATILHTRLDDFWFVWLAPALLAWYWMVHRQTAQATITPSPQLG